MFQQEIKISPELQEMIRNSKDKVGVGRAIATAMDRQNELTLNVIKQSLSGGLLRVRTGTLIRSFEGKAGRTDAVVIQDAEGTEVRSSVGSNVGIGEPVDHAAPLEFGSRPHVIEPKPERGPRAALRFAIGGQILIRKRVNHPGNRAYNYIRGAVESRLPNYSRGLNDAAYKFLMGGKAE